MREPDFLSLDEVLAIHDVQLERYGGATGIRDLGLLESALAQPMAGFGGQYLHADLFEMAAAYLYHIAQNHPFVDGNKRAGLESAMTFLELNGFDVDAPQDALEDMVLAVASGRRDKAGVAAFFREHTRPRET